MTTEVTAYETASRIVAYRRALAGPDRLAAAIDRLGGNAVWSANLFHRIQDPSHGHHRRQYQSLFDSCTDTGPSQHGRTMTARRDQRTLVMDVDDQAQVTSISRQIEDVAEFTGPPRFATLVKTDPMRAAAYWISQPGPTSILDSLAPEHTTVDLLPETGLISVQLSGGMALPATDRIRIIGPHPNRRTWQKAVASTVNELVDERTPEHTKRSIRNLEKTLRNRRTPPRGLAYAHDLNARCLKILNSASISTDGRLYPQTQYEHAKLLFDQLHLDLTARGTHTPWNSVDGAVKDNEVVRITHRNRNREITSQTLRFGSAIPPEMRKSLQQAPEKFPSRPYTRPVQAGSRRHINPSTPRPGL